MRPYLSNFHDHTHKQALCFHQQTKQQPGFHDLLFNLGCTVNKVVFPEVVGGVLDQLNEGDEQAPGMRSVHNQTRQQDTAEEEDRQLVPLSLEALRPKEIPGNTQ